MKKYKNIIFDVGDVLLKYRWRDMLADYGLDEESVERVGNELFHDPDGLWQAFDLAVMTEDEIAAEYCRKYPADAEAISWFISHGEYMHVAMPKVWKAVHELKKAGYKIYLLSNYPENLFKKHTQYADFMKDIDGLTVSYMINIAKPDRRIYENLCKKYRLTPSECLFFDDRQINVDGAIACGMAAKRVTTQEKLLADLDKLINEA